MGRGAPNKKGLSYFPKMTDFYEDDKIFELLDRYGPLGVTVYDCILCIVYRHGYYAEIPLDKLSKMITRMIGNKWVKNQKAVVQVVHFCSEIGLIDDALMTEHIITSVGIQRRYYEIAVKRMKRQLYSDKYWLLEKEDSEPLLNAPKKEISSEENRITSEESPIKRKENKNIDICENPTPFHSPELEHAFQLFLLTQERNGRKLSPEQIALLKKELMDLGDSDEERLSIANKAIVSGWKSFYPLKKQKQKNKGSIPDRPKKTKFSNFKERDYDMDALEAELLKAQEENHGTFDR